MFRRYDRLAAVAFAAAGIVLAISVTAPAAESGKTGGLTYFDGLRIGEAQGRLEGGAVAVGRSLPSGQRAAAEAAYKAGYAAGANDAFTGFDGGWAMASPYIVTLERGDGAITYRIGTRVLLEPGNNYFLCPDGHSLCQAPRK